jgi:hypothetical protein
MLTSFVYKDTNTKAFLTYYQIYDTEINNVDISLDQTISHQRALYAVWQHLYQRIGLFAKILGRL